MLSNFNRFDLSILDYEILTFETVDIDIENAGEEELIAVRHHQTVTEKEK